MLTRSSAFAALANLGYTSDIIIIIIIIIIICKCSSSLFVHLALYHNYYHCCLFQRRGEAWRKERLLTFKEEYKGRSTEYLLYQLQCLSSDKTPWSPPLIDIQSSRRPPVAMCYCRRSVVCYCRPRLWNSLPADVRSASSLTAFRQKLKTHLFRQSYPDIVL